MSKAAQRRLDARISRAYAIGCSGVQVPIMELGKIHRAAEQWIRLNPDGSDHALSQAIRAYVDSIVPVVLK